MKAAIALDDWKLPIFRERLTEAGFTYEDAGEFTPEMTVLTVVTQDMVRLERVVRRAHDACKRLKHD